MKPADRIGPRRRWWRIAAPAVLIAGVGLLLALPALVSRTVARRILTTRAGRLLSPGSLDASAVRVSWFGPTVIEGAVLRDERGHPLITANRAVFGWNLWQILFRPPEDAVLELPGAEVDVGRRPGGQIDLYEALRPIIREDPRHRLVVAIGRGRLRFRDPALPEPFIAEEADIRLDVPRDRQPIEWDIRLAHGAGGGQESGRAVFKGRVHRPGDGDASISLEVSRWPWVATFAGAATRGVLDGTLKAERRESGWVLSGEATAADLVASGSDAKDRPAPLRLGPIRAAWDVEGRDGVWTSRRLALATSLEPPKGGAASEEARGKPLTLDLVARYTAPTGRLDIAHFSMAIPYARVDGSGLVEGAGEGPRLDLKGTTAPDWESIQADLRRDVDPNARIAGRPRAWRLAGTLGRRGAEDRLAGLAGELGVQLDAMDVYGMRLGETAVVLRADGGRFRLDPIDARLNEGALHLEPEIVRPADGPPRLTLGAASTLRDAQVNDEVSHRILSYVAPVLDGATRVNGRVSVRGLDAEFPLARTATAAAKVQGDILFDEVRFLPGPLAETVIDLLPNARDAGAGDGPMLVLRDPISFRIADRRVYQHGLNVPVGRIGSIALEGSVDFEKRLDLLARFRVNPPRADKPVLAALLNNARLELPIRGTIAAPKIDQDELKERLRSIGSDMMGNSVAAGAEGLMRLLEGAARRREAREAPADDPEAESPRPSPEERRQLREQRRLERQEKKAQRRMRRGEPPE